MSKWATLPGHITPAKWLAVQERLQKEMRHLLSSAGFQFRISSGRVKVCVRNDKTMVYATPLQNKSGALRADIRKKLTQDTFPGQGLEGAVEQIQASPGFDKQNIDRWMGLQLAFLQTQDPVQAVRDFSKLQSNLRFYRLGATESFTLRQFVWRLIDHLYDGIPAAQMPLGGARRDNMLITGLIEAMPGSLICAPLTARFQPLAAELMTRIGSEVAVLPPGSGYVRSASMGGWPVGGGRVNLSGRGKGIYATSIRSLPAEHAETLLYQSAAGVNRLLSKFTDPAEFTNQGELDRDEQSIAWANMRFGLEAINSMASEWGRPEAVWSAFRALGTLQGIWEGPVQGKFALWELLNPQRIRNHVLPCLIDPTHRTWAEGMIANYESELRSGFPGYNLEEAARHIQELRHLVHGVGGQGKRARDSRLATLRFLASNEPNVQLVCDVASLWWTAAILSPDRITRPGRAPWSP